MGTTRVLTAAAVATAVGTTLCVAQVTTFVVLPPGPGHTYLQPRGMSGDGTTVVGSSGVLGSGNVEAYRWTATEGGQNIGALIAGPFSIAYATTNNGTSVFGEGNSSDGFAWTAPASVSPLAGGPVLDVSADGAVRLTQTQVIGSAAVALPALPGDQSVAAVSISAAGTAAALTSHFFQSGGSGYGYGGGPDIVRDQACSWTQTGGTVGCGFLPGTDRSFATSISEDGAVVLGGARSGNTGAARAFRWTAGSGISELLPIAGQPAVSDVVPIDSSADGSVVLCDVDGESMIWTQSEGFRPLKQILVANGWDVSLWAFFSAGGLSDDGGVVTGQAIDGQGSLHAYVTPLTATCSGPANPWTASRRVIVAEGDALPGGGVAGLVNDATVNASGAALVRVVDDLWLVNPDATMERVIAGQSDGFSAVVSATMNDAGVIAAVRGRSQFIGGTPGSTEFVRSVVVGSPGAMVTVASHGDAAPTEGGGGTLRTYGDFYGPLMSNGIGAAGGLACFQSGIDGGTSGGVRAFVYDPQIGGPLVRSVPAVSITSPVLRGVSDNGVVVRTAAEGILAGGPPPAVEALIAAPGSVAPGFTGATFASFSDVGVNGAGTVVFHAGVNTPAGTRDAVYTCASGGTPQLLAAEGMELSSGVTIIGISRVMIGATGSAYFTASLNDGRTSVVKGKPGGTLILAAADGDAAPGPGPCRELRNWGLLGVDGRRVLLSATASGPSGSATVLATWGEEEGLSIVARTGETISLRPGLTGLVTGAGPSVLGGNGQDGQAHAMRGNHLIYTVSLSTAGGPIRAVVSDELPALPCGMADVGAQGGVHASDGHLDNNDFIAFIDLFFAGDPRADFGSQGGVPGANGVLDNNDFIVFIDRFFSGCV